MKATQKRYIDCQRNPHHVFNNGEVEMIIGQEVYEGILVEARDGSNQRFRISAHMHNGQLTLDISTPDYNPAEVLGEDKQGKRVLRRKIILTMEREAIRDTSEVQGAKHSLYRA